MTNGWKPMRIPNGFGRAVTRGLELESELCRPFLKSPRCEFLELLKTNQDSAELARARLDLPYNRTGLRFIHSPPARHPQRNFIKKIPLGDAGEVEPG